MNASLPTRYPRRPSVLAAALLAAFLVGCSDYQGGVQSPESFKPAGPSPDSTLSDDECYVLHGTREPLPHSIETMAALSSVIVVGTFEGYGKPFWNTPNGARPTHEELTTSSARIVRPVLIAAEAALRGSVDETANALVAGGEIGCDSITYDPDLSLNVGVSYVLFLAPIADSSGKVGVSVVPLDGWPVRKDDVVDTPLDGQQTLIALTAAIAATPYTGIYTGEPNSSEDPEPTPVESNLP
jgi:hypothetical protein